MASHRRMSSSRLVLYGWGCHGCASTVRGERPWTFGFVSRQFQALHRQKPVWHQFASAQAVAFRPAFIYFRHCKFCKKFKLNLALRM